MNFLTCESFFSIRLVWLDHISFGRQERSPYTVAIPQASPNPFGTPFPFPYQYWVFLGTQETFLRFPISLEGHFTKTFIKSINNFVNEWSLYVAADQVMHSTNAICMFLNICDPTRANEALWARYQNWHFKFNIHVLFNIQGTFWHQNHFHITFQSKVTDILISNCLITSKINYQDMGRQSYWFVHKPIEDIKNNWIKT